MNETKQSGARTNTTAPSGDPLASGPPPKTTAARPGKPLRPAAAEDNAGDAPAAAERLVETILTLSAAGKGPAVAIVLADPNDPLLATAASTINFDPLPKAAQRLLQRLFSGIRNLPLRERMYTTVGGSQDEVKSITAAVLWLFERVNAAAESASPERQPE